MKRSSKPVLIYEVLHGSRAYNLATQNSDTDIKGVIIGPRSWYLGVLPSPEQVEMTADHMHFEIRKFLRLAAAANPTIFEMLWVDHADVKLITPLGQRLVNARDLFMTQKTKDTFAGYALSQLKRIKTHRHWLMQPPKEEPLRKEFGLPERSLISQDQFGAAQALIEKGRIEEADLSTNFLEILDREKRYRHARKEWKQYNEWKTHRNPARAELEARHGYDTKHAMHLVRLQRMAVEILREATVVVRRPDRSELLAIRDGQLSYEELLEECEQLAEEIRIAARGSKLPMEPDIEAIQELAISITEEAIHAGT
jgi:uncharacterized protein